MSLGLVPACADDRPRPVTVVVGYQSKTINTVTAGTLLRDSGGFEGELAELGRATGVRYEVEWQDYDTGAPITAQMVAEKIDIGSMGDFPLVINGSKTQPYDRARSELVAITAYAPTGGLNGIVVPTGSAASGPADLVGGRVSTSRGSAGHGLLIKALREADLSEGEVAVENQAPSVGSSALRAGSTDAMSQFTPWPGLSVFRGEAELMYDGASTGTPTFHGVVARSSFVDDHPEVLSAFLRSVRTTTDDLHADPLAAAVRVADLTDLPPEVVYLYNGPNGIATFDPTIKPSLVDALHEDRDLLESVEGPMPLDVDAFVQDRYLRDAWGDGYDAAVSSSDNPAAISGAEAPCGNTAWDPSLASEVWVDGETTTRAADTPTCLLRTLRALSPDETVRAAYVPDSSTGTRWFAEKSIWVVDTEQPEGQVNLPFASRAAADAYLGAHPGAREVPFSEAVATA